MNTFQELDLSVPMVRAITELGYQKPSQIQSEALPVLLGEPTDFIGLAATGTGKTAAFSIPLLEKIDSQSKHVQCLVMCPTRELALQVTGQIVLLGKYMGIKAVAVYGGAGYNDQIHGLKSGAQVVVGTPGRLIDHIERGTLQLQDVRTVVLDEADEMISMGFKEELETVLNSIPDENRKIWLFSATMSKEVRKVADQYLLQPKQVQVNRTEMLSSSVEQIFYPMRESDKPEILCKIIEAADDFYGIVFCQTKSLVMDLTQYLSSRGYRVDCLHGDKTQMDRERSMRAFREKKVSVLVCTDVASRGLDVKDVTHVINYSIPRELDVYVHRIGRTARVGKSGVAISLVTPSHRGLISRIEKMTKSKIKEGKIPTRKDVAMKKVGKLLTQFQNQTGYPRAIELLSLEWIESISNMSVEEVVGRFLCLMHPEIFAAQEKQKPLQPKIQSDPQGNAIGRRDKKEKDDHRGGRKHSRRDRDRRDRARRHQARHEDQRRGAGIATDSW